MIFLSKIPAKKVRTKNIANSISKFAAEHILKPNEYNFKINETKTLIKTSAMDDFVSYEEDIHNYYKYPDKLINEHVEFQQIYTITIKKNLPKIIILKYEIDFSDNNVNPSIIISPDSLIPYKEYSAKEIYELLISEIDCIKARNKILIQIFDKNMKNKLKIFVKYIYQKKFKKKIRIPLFDGIPIETTKSSKLIKYYLKKPNKNQIIEVEPNELLIDYIKPIFGKNGLNAFGKIISNSYQKNLGDLDLHVDPKSIEIQESNTKKSYISKIKGFVHLDTTSFYIDNKIKMQTLSRVQDSLAKEESNNIEVTISQHDTNIDSIGEGVELTSETIHVDGHVGAKTKLEAINLTIDGATHGDSLQEAKFAEINRHKGKLRCHSAKIKLLEGGEIHATNVHVDTTLGGSIYAQDVTIGHVKNNLKVYASNSITIKRVSGEDNIFKISYKNIPTLSAKCNFIQKDIDDLKYELDGALKHTPQQVPILKEKIKKLNAVIVNIKEAVFDAKIIITEPLSGLNSIVFTIDDENELVFKTDAIKYDSFYIEQKDNNILLHPTNKKITIDS